MTSFQLSHPEPVELPTNEPQQRRSRVDPKVVRPLNSNMLRKKIFIAVMGVTGAGKSSFIKSASGIDEVVVGHDLTSCELLFNQKRRGLTLTT